MSEIEGPRDEPFAEPVDPEADQRELEAAGWKRIERQGKIVWRNPESGHLYPQGVAIALVRERAEAQDLPQGSEGAARSVREPERGSGARPDEEPGPS